MGTTPTDFTNMPPKCTSMIRVCPYPRCEYKADKDIKQQLASVQAELEEAKREIHLCTIESSGLATAMHKRHYAEIAPNWGLCDTPSGIMTQIDNMYCGIRDNLKAAERERDELRELNEKLTKRFNHMCEVTAEAVTVTEPSDHPLYQAETRMRQIAEYETIPQLKAENKVLWEENERLNLLYNGLKNEIPSITSEAVETALKSIEGDVFEKVVMPAVKAATQRLTGENTTLKETAERYRKALERIKKGWTLDELQMQGIAKEVLEGK